MFRKKGGNDHDAGMQAWDRTLHLEGIKWTNEHLMSWSNDFVSTDRPGDVIAQ